MFASFGVFPFLSFGVAGGLSGEIGFSNFIVTTVFIIMWLLVLFAAVKLQSKALFTMYKWYWLMAIFALFFTVIGEIFEIVVVFISFFYVAPFFGVGYLIPNAIMISDIAPFVILTLIALCLFLTGVFIKKKFLK